MKHIYKAFFVLIFLASASKASAAENNAPKNILANLGNQNLSLNGQIGFSSSFISDNLAKSQIMNNLFGNSKQINLGFDGDINQSAGPRIAHWQVFPLSSSSTRFDFISDEKNIYLPAGELLKSLNSFGIDTGNAGWIAVDLGQNYGPINIKSLLSPNQPYVGTVLNNPESLFKISPAGTETINGKINRKYNISVQKKFLDSLYPESVNNMKNFARGAKGNVWVDESNSLLTRFSFASTLKSLKHDVPDKNFNVRIDFAPVASTTPINLPTSTVNLQSLINQAFTKIAGLTGNFGFLSPEESFSVESTSTISSEREETNTSSNMVSSTENNTSDNSSDISSDNTSFNPDVTYDIPFSERPDTSSNNSNVSSTSGVTTPSTSVSNTTQTLPGSSSPTPSTTTTTISQTTTTTTTSSGSILKIQK